MVKNIFNYKCRSLSHFCNKQLLSVSFGYLRGRGVVYTEVVHMECLEGDYARGGTIYGGTLSIPDICIHNI